MKSHKDLPAILELKDGRNIAIQGYILSAQCETSDDLNRYWANRILNNAATLAAQTVPGIVDDWVVQYTRERNLSSRIKSEGEK